MLQTPFYDPTKSYEENYDQGPFGVFHEPTLFTHSSPPAQSIFGIPLHLPFGIPAGPLLNSAFVKGAFDMGFDVCVYKTVRANSYPCHPFPNVLAVHIDGDLTLEKASGTMVADANYAEPLSITNSFGVPSKDPGVWQEDVQKAVSYAHEGQLLVHSFMGTVKEGQTRSEFIEDFVLAARLSKETHAKVLEVNLSCPNIGNEGLVCYNLDVTADVLKAIRRVIGNTPLLVKVGYFADQTQVEKLAEIIAEYADGIAAINTIPSTIVNENGEQALPGKNRAKSGVCGTGIKWAGLSMVTRLNELRVQKKYTFQIVGVGGVVTPKDYTEYREAGADCVMSATGAMWNPYLAQQINAT